MNLHYCMGKLISWGLADNETSNCNFCGMPKNSPVGEITGKGCCKDEHKYIQSEKDQKASEFSFQALKYFRVVFTEYNNPQALFPYSPTVDYPTANSPPYSQKVPAFILNCVYRI